MGAILLMKDFFPGDDMEKCFAMEEGIAMEDIFQGEGLGWLAILDWHWPNFGTVRTFLPHLWFEDVFFWPKNPPTHEDGHEDGDHSDLQNLGVPQDMKYEIQISTYETP